MAQSTAEHEEHKARRLPLVITKCWPVLTAIGRKNVDLNRVGWLIEPYSRGTLKREDLGLVLRSQGHSATGSF